MSGETEANVSGWSVDTLRAHIATVMAQIELRFDAAITAAELRNEQRFTAQQQAIKDAFVAAEKAVFVAEANAEKWRGNANEWRGAMSDRERTLMPRSEAEARYKGIDEKHDALAARVEAGDKVNSEAVRALALATEKTAGRREGLMIVFAVIAAIATVISIVAALRG